MTKVVVIEDETLLRDFICKLVEKELKMDLVGASGNGQEALQICLKVRPELVLLDLSLPNLNGQEILRRLKKKLPKTRILIFSGYLDVPLVKRVMSSGADGYLEKTVSMDEFCEAIQSVLNGHSYYSQRVIDAMRRIMVKPEEKDELDSLTNREREVLQLIAEGYSSKEIATQLDISVKTAETHRAKLMKKLNIHKAVEAAGYAIQKGLYYSSKSTSQSDSSEESALEFEPIREKEDMLN